MADIDDLEDIVGLSRRADRTSAHGLRRGKPVQPTPSSVLKAKLSRASTVCNKAKITLAGRGREK